MTLPCAPGTFRSRSAAHAGPGGACTDDGLHQATVCLLGSALNSWCCPEHQELVAFGRCSCPASPPASTSEVDAMFKTILPRVLRARMRDMASGNCSKGRNWSATGGSRQPLDLSRKTTSPNNYGEDNPSGPNAVATSFRRNRELPAYRLWRRCGRRVQPQLQDAGLRRTSGLVRRTESARLALAGASRESAQCPFSSSLRCCEWRRGTARKSGSPALGRRRRFLMPDRRSAPPRRSLQPA